MPIKFTKLSAILVIATIASLFSIEAKAEVDSLDEAFEAAYFTKGKNAFTQSNALNQANTIFGFTGFPEQHIVRDGQAVDRIYELGLERQASTAERLVTRDLDNPYNTSLKENPSYSAFE